MSEPQTLNKTSHIDPVFQTVKDKDGLRSWLVRAYFNPARHSSEPYYSTRVTKENVLEYITSKPALFPQKPLNIVNVWKILPDLRSSLKFVPGEDNLVKEKESLYTKAETTLSQIGARIGGVTTTMVNKISDQAVTKFGTLLRALDSKEEDIAIRAKDKIDDAFLTVAEGFADAVGESKTPEEILSKVVSKGLLGKHDLELMDATEREAFEELILMATEDNASQSELEDIFLADLDKHVNVFRTVQMAVSRIIFPPPRRGRPPKA